MHFAYQIYYFSNFCVQKSRTYVGSYMRLFVIKTFPVLCVLAPYPGVRRCLWFASPKCCLSMQLPQSEAYYIVSFP